MFFLTPPRVLDQELTLGHRGNFPVTIFHTVPYPSTQLPAMTLREMGVRTRKKLTEQVRFLHA